MEGERIGELLVDEGSQEALEKAYEMTADPFVYVGFWISFLLASRGHISGMEGLVSITNREDDPEDLSGNTEEYRKKASDALKSLLGLDLQEPVDWPKWFAENRERLYWVPELRVYLLKLEK